MTEPAVRGGKVAIQDDQGNVSLVDPATGARLIQHGYQPVSDKAFADAEQRREDESLKGIAKTAALNIGEGAVTITAGAARAADKLLGAPERALQRLFESSLPEQTQKGLALEEARLREAAPDLTHDAMAQLGATTPEEMARLNMNNPGTAGVSQFIGESAPMIAFGAALPELGAASAWGRVGVQAARGAAEMGAYGAAAAGRDPNADAEHILASGGLAALLGAATMGGLGAAGLGLGKLRGLVGRGGSELGAEAAERASIEGEMATAAEGTGKAGAEAAQGLRQKAVDYYHATTGAPKELLAEVGPGAPRAGEAIRASAELPGLVDKTALDVAPKLNQLENLVNTVTKEVRANALKEENIRAVGGIKDVAVGRAMVDTTIDNAASVINELSPERMALLPASAKKEFRALLSEMRDASMAGEEIDGAKTFMIGNGVKQRLDSTIKNFRKDIVNNMTLGSGEKAELESVAQGLQSVSDKLRAGLEDSSVWGDKVAAMQRKVNAEWSGGAIQAQRDFGEAFMKRRSNEPNFETGRYEYEADPAKVAGGLSSLGTANGALRERAINDYLEHTNKLLDTIGETYKLNPAAKKALEEARPIFDEVKQSFRAVSEQSKLASKWEELRKYNVPFADGAGTLTNMLMNPAAASTFFAKISAAKEHIGRMLGTTQKWISSGAAPTAEKAVSGGQMKALRAAGSLASMALFRGNFKTDQDAYDARVKTVLAANVDALGQHLDGAPPDLQLAAGVQSAAAVQFLRDQIPPYAQSPGLGSATKKAMVSEYERQKFAKAWATVADPRTAIADLKAGRMTPTQAKALREVYPGLYQDLQMTVMRGLGQADASGKQIPIYRRQQFDTLLALNGAGEPAFAPSTVGRVQQAFAMQEKQQRQPQRPSMKQPQSQALISPIMKSLGV